MEVFLLSGKSASGKDTLANIMREKLEAVGCKTLILHFADLVKFYCKQYWNWNGEKDENGRALLQKVGTDIMRNFDKDYWTRIIGEFLAALNIYENFDCAFIPDARFPNEIEVVQDYNPQAITIRLERYNKYGSPYTNPLLTSEQLQHASEIGLDEYGYFDYIVENHSEDLSDLESAAKLILTDTGLLV